MAAVGEKQMAVERLENHCQRAQRITMSSSPRLKYLYGPVTCLGPLIWLAAVEYFVVQYVVGFSVADSFQPASQSDE
jgi:hypothetical protein